MVLRLRQLSCLWRAAARSEAGIARPTANPAVITAGGSVIITIDYHVHSLYSDGTDRLVSIFQSAADRGLTEIGISDHLDLDCADPFFNRLDLAAQADEIERARHRFAGKLIIRWGVEVSHQDGLESEIEAALADWPLDFVIGSVHRVDGRDFSSPGDVAAIAADSDWTEAAAAYLSAMASCARSDLYDIIGHFDVIKRYGVRHWGTPDWAPVSDLIDAALMAAVQTGKLLEINTSGWSQSPREPYPSQQLLARYRRLGGTAVTIGSDSHSRRKVGRHAARAKGLAARCGLEIARFSLRNRL